MTNTIVAAVTRKLNDAELMQVRASLDAELAAACEAGVKGTQAHVGMIEMLEAATAELRRRIEHRASK